MRHQKKFAVSIGASIAIFAALAFARFALPENFPFIFEKKSVLSEAKMFAPLSSNGRGADTPQNALAEATATPDSAVEKPIDRKIEAAEFSPLTIRAAQQNALLQVNLTWAFGGKAQRGWFLYAPLMQETFAVKQDAASPEFANAVGDFQKQNGMTATGMVDDKTLYKIIEFWQSRRLKNSDYPSPDRLLTAPIADFYDPTRGIELRSVERETYAAYKRMVAAALKNKSLNLRTTASGELAPDEKFLKIVSAFRSREYQEKLRRESPNSGSAGLATNSPHFTGRALDLYVGGEPVTTKDFNRAIQIQTPVYKWLVKNAEHFGFRPYFYEPWHWEFIPENLRKSP